jgi:hypothetical protein
MPILINGTGTITGVGTTGISSAPRFPGNIIQVVNGTYSTATTNSTTTFADTGLTTSITPTSATSKILVLVNHSGTGKFNANLGVNLALLRGATTIITFEKDAGYTNNTTPNYVAGAVTCYLDSPATTSSTTYKTQFASSTAGATAYVQLSGSTSTITLLEVAA